jgi:hypothetical protein
MGAGEEGGRANHQTMLLIGFHMLQLIPRQALMRLALATLAAAVTLVVLPGPATAKGTNELKSIKKELVRLESMHDERVAQLDRLGARWDALQEAGSSSSAIGAYLGSTFRAIAQTHVETSMLEVRETIRALEKKRDKAITALEKIVIERQHKKLAASGLTPALMPSMNVGGSLVTYSADWEKTAMCESTKRWHIDSRYDGGLQFDPITWIEFGGAEFARYAYQATKLQQIAVAERVLVIQGPKAWPNCFTPLPVDAEG